MSSTKIYEYINNGNTILGIGPVSMNVINAALEFANENPFIPIMIIPSRRQIDDTSIRKGYVNNWSTEEFTKYIRNNQLFDNIVLVRDHGGPWQNNYEIDKKMNLKDAMKSAEESYARDIDAGFDILHIDPSIDIEGQISYKEIMERLIILYEFCSSYAAKNNKVIEYEIGTEEQIIHPVSISEFSNILDDIKAYLHAKQLQKPMFTVLQIGTKVMEMQNIGILNRAGNKDELFNQIKQLCNLAIENGIFVKVHNTDYLNTDVLQKFPSLNISAANVAPEFGITETKTLIDILERNNLNSLANDFLNYSYNSKKWGKWIIPNSKISDRDKAILSGHYVLSEEYIVKLLENAQKQIKNIDINEYIKNELKKNIMKYINSFNINTKQNRNVYDTDYTKAVG